MPNVETLAERVEPGIEVFAGPADYTAKTGSPVPPVNANLGRKAWRAALGRAAAPFWRINYQTNRMEQFTLPEDVATTANFPYQQIPTPPLPYVPPNVTGTYTAQFGFAELTETEISDGTHLLLTRKRDVDMLVALLAGTPGAPVAVFASVHTEVGEVGKTHYVFSDPNDADVDHFVLSYQAWRGIEMGDLIEQMYALNPRRPGHWVLLSGNTLRVDPPPAAAHLPEVPAPLRFDPATDELVFPVMGSPVIRQKLATTGGGLTAEQDKKLTDIWNLVVKGPQ